MEADCVLVHAVWQAMANNYGTFVSTVPAFLNVVDFAHKLVGPKPLEYLSGAMNRMTNHLVPTWNPYMPRVRPPLLPPLHPTPLPCTVFLSHASPWTSQRHKFSGGISLK